MRLIPLLLKGYILFFWLLLLPTSGHFAQDNGPLLLKRGAIQQFNFAEAKLSADSKPPMVSFELDQNKYRSDDPLPEGISLSFGEDSLIQSAIYRSVCFKNRGKDTLLLHNVVPLGTEDKLVYLTGKGDHWLSRSHLFLPGRAPLNVILPDNAWELGYSAMKMSGAYSVAALARRNLSTLKNGQRRRFETILYPGGQVTYDCYFVPYQGPWQSGLRTIFQEYKLFDVLNFDSQLYERDDLKWVQDDYVIHLLMAWDQAIDKENGVLALDQFLANAERWYGGDDAIGIWPTWPTLGLDERNQFDLYRDLPGGLAHLRELSQQLEKQGSGLFLCYNPWDESTRGEDHLDGLYQIVKATQARGLVLDTRGASSYDLQAAADSARSGVLMYSEGMAVPKDMQGIVSGRVHNALYYPPLLNLNRLIKPDFSVFRVAEIAKEKIRREINLSFFNGHGIEFNLFSPGKPSWVEDQYRYLGQTVSVLRGHSSNFSQKEFTPLIPTRKDHIYVNQWPGKHSIVYTLFSLSPAGYQEPLFEVNPLQDHHFFDLFHYREIETDTLNNKVYAIVDLPGFEARYLGTNNEGAVGGIARYKRLIDLSRSSDELQIRTQRGDSLLLWAGQPAYDKVPLKLSARDTSLFLHENFPNFEGRFVVQLMENQEIIDQRSFQVKAGTPRLISRIENTLPAEARQGMVRIPSGAFRFKTTHGDDFISYPTYNENDVYEMKAFLMDKHPVTNGEFARFLQETRYVPKDKLRFLKHWPEGLLPDSLFQHPVVYISYEDARAYAKWAGKRLPSEIEWQYAAQAGDGRDWPWSKDTQSIYREKERVTSTLTVYQIKGIDSRLCNLGSGQLDPIGAYPAGTNPFGLEDLVGSVWQLTNDIYRSGSYSYIMMKGGSYFNPSSSWWYVQGGPRELHYRQYLLRVSPGFERNATVGFRCVQDLPTH